MPLSALLQEVDKRVEEGMVAALFPKLKESHTRKNGPWRTCACEWCSHKRRTASYIARAIMPDFHHVEALPPSVMFSTRKDAYRDHLRKLFRAERKLLFEK